MTTEIKNNKISACRDLVSFTEQPKKPLNRQPFYAILRASRQLQ
jgi:hypothetical protein